MKTYQIKFCTEYGQFYINDKESPFETEAKDFWTEKASQKGLATGFQILGIGTSTEGNVNLELSLIENEKEILEETLSNSTEGTLDVSSGNLEVNSCTGIVPEFQLEIQPGVYKIKIFSNYSLKENIGDTYHIYMIQEK